MYYTHEVVKLNITTWAGTIAMGEHWYGRLHYHMPEYVEDKCGLREKCEYDVDYVIDKASAIRLNGTDENNEPGQFFGVNRYKIGETCHRFFGRDYLVKRAKLAFNEITPHGRVLLECDWSSCGPVEIIVGPRKLMRLGNQLWRKWEDSEDNDALCCLLERQWKALFKKAGFLDLTSM